MKRPNGDGTIRQRPNGSWEARYTETDPATGQTKRKSLYARTKQEVAQKLRERLVALGKGEAITESKITMRDWLSIYLSDFSISLADSSKRLYERMAKNYIIPNLGAMKLKDIRPNTIQRMVNNLQRQGLSPHTIKDAHGFLHGVLDKAALCGHISNNPCHDIELPKVVKPDITLIDEGHITPFLQACREDRYGDYLALLLYTGMRESELMGLPWKNVDFENGTLTISQQLENRTYEITTTKTGKGRTFKPAAVVMDILKRIKAQQDQYKAQMGDSWRDTHDLVFTSEIGEHYCHNTVRKHLHRIAETIGLPDLRVHDLRHSYSVVAILAGEDVKSIQGTLGHSTIVTTMDIYSRFSKDLQQASSNRMSDYFSRF